MIKIMFQTAIHYLANMGHSSIHKHDQDKEADLFPNSYKMLDMLISHAVFAGEYPCNVGTL